MRVAHAVLGGLVAVGWLVLPVAEAGADDPVAPARNGQVSGKVGALGDRKPVGTDAVAAGQPVPTQSITPAEADPGEDETAASDLVLPVGVVAAAGAVAAFTYLRRRRRARTRTTPGGDLGIPPVASLPELDRQAGMALVETDDAIRTSAEELGFATDQFGEEAVTPYAEALAYAKSELSAAFRLRQRLDDALPEDDADRRRMLEEIVARCAQAQRRLDAEAPGFDQLRALERDMPQALEQAETRFRELATRAGAIAATPAALGKRYSPSAALPVAGHVEQAKDRLVFATTHLNQARQSLDLDDHGQAAVHLRAAEGAVDQAGTFLDAVDRLAADLATAAAKLPAALTGTETDLADARGLLQGTAAAVPTGDLQGRIARAESVSAEVRREMDSGPYDPIDALRRVEQADIALDEALAGARAREDADRRALALLGHSLVTTGSAVATASDFVTTHRGAVGSEARTRLAEAERRLARAETAATVPETPDASAALADARQAGGLAREALRLAERDVRAYGNPYDGGTVAGGHGGGGMSGAVLGGIILGEAGSGAGARAAGHARQGGGPGSFGGAGTRGRRGGGGRF
ncbi:TPM domain-containing protein [Streptomyces sp. NPDC005485]|uniref:TPM domain-containing protein n=1 Tax=Streptomyces sp. NPDC005485 TaxID=3155591 RepID=UPI0033B74911